VVKDGVTRDKLKKDFNVLCVEMEAAEIQETLPGLIIRGISDYADSHKNDDWQPYATAMAAAYMKVLLLSIPESEMACEIFSVAEKIRGPTIAITNALSRTKLEQILEGRANTFGQRLNWRDSIIDLLKLLHQNSSVQYRNELATNLGVTVGTAGSIERNTALHKVVMEELQSNSGRIFARLLH